MHLYNQTCSRFRYRYGFLYQAFNLQSQKFQGPERNGRVWLLGHGTSIKRCSVYNHQVRPVSLVFLNVSIVDDTLSGKVALNIHLGQIDSVSEILWDSQFLQSSSTSGPAQTKLLKTRFSPTEWPMASPIEWQEVGWTANCLQGIKYGLCGRWSEVFVKCDYSSRIRLIFHLSRHLHFTDGRRKHLPQPQAMQ